MSEKLALAKRQALEMWITQEMWSKISFEKFCERYTLTLRQMLREKIK